MYLLLTNRKARFFWAVGPSAAPKNQIQIMYLPYESYSLDTNGQSAALPIKQTYTAGSAGLLILCTSDLYHSASFRVVLFFRAVD